jgi:uncharacterized protein YcgI (DUF1989 family)
MHITVPARSGRAVQLERGTSLRITDIAGQQVGDLFAFAGDDYLSASHTRTATSRLFPARRSVRHEPPPPDPHPHQRHVAR